MESVLAANEMATSQYPSVIALWDLGKTATESQPPEAIFAPSESLRGEYEKNESVIGTDERKLVSAKDYAPGGKYRSIVKLFCRMEGQAEKAPWMMATGWLIRDDLLVTAGHVACDWDHKFGLLKEIKCYIGYHGRDKVKSPHVEMRHGATVAAPAEWIRGPNSAYDVSFIKLDKPFTDIQPIRYVNTPARGSLTLGVVGYPGDLKSGGKYGGERMYEMFLPVKFNLATTNKMLQYQIDTFGGNSGSPVLNKAGMTAIGVHVLGGTINSASVIGPLGNNFHSFVTSFTRKSASAVTTQGSKVPKAKNFRIVSIRAFESPAGSLSDGPTTRPAKGAAAVNGVHDSKGTKEALDAEALGDEAIDDEESAEAGEEESIFSSIAKLAMPAMGILGGPVGAIASTALSMVGPKIVNAVKPKKKKESEQDGEAGQDEADEEAVNGDDEAGDEESRMLTGNFGPGTSKGATKDIKTRPAGNGAPNSLFPPEFSGTPARAILAQAALQSVVSLPPSVLDQHGIFDKMQKTVSKFQKSSRRINPLLSKIVQPTALDVVLEEVQKNRLQKSGTLPKNAAKPKVESSDGEGLADGTESFFEAFTADSSLEEAELSTESINDLVREALGAGTPGLDESIFEAFEAMMPPPSESSEESTMESAIGPSSALNGLAEGAILAEAALEALVALPAEVTQTEGLLDSVRNVIKVVAPVVKKHGPPLWKKMVEGSGVVSGVAAGAYLKDRANGKESAEDAGGQKKVYGESFMSPQIEDVKDEADLHEPAKLVNGEVNGDDSGEADMNGEAGGDDSGEADINGETGDDSGQAAATNGDMNDSGEADINDETNGGGDDSEVLDLRNPKKQNLKPGVLPQKQQVGLPNPFVTPPPQEPTLIDPNFDRFRKWWIDHAKNSSSKASLAVEPPVGIKAGMKAVKVN